MPCHNLFLLHYKYDINIQQAVHNKIFSQSIKTFSDDQGKDINRFDRSGQAVLEVYQSLTNNLIRYILLISFSNQAMILMEKI